MPGGFSILLRNVISFNRFILRTVSALARDGVPLRPLLREFDHLSYGSLPVVIFSVITATVVTVTESHFHMNLVLGDAGMVPGFSAMVAVREMGPVVASLLLSARVGTGWAAETAAMTLTEQIDAMRLLGIDPHSRIVIPRVVASCIGTSILSIISVAVSLCVIAFLYLVVGGHSPMIFFDPLKILLSVNDIFMVMVKGAVFGVATALAACYSGLHEVHSARDAGASSARALVSATVMIFFLDFCIDYVAVTLLTWY